VLLVVALLADTRLPSWVAAVALGVGLIAL
jgi:hypothetical protein